MSNELSAKLVGRLAVKNGTSFITTSRLGWRVGSQNDQTHPDGEELYMKLDMPWRDIISGKVASTR
ncbi:hypothetical protein V9K92_14880 [Phyllobacterium sp. CCNWLW109]